jgi:Glycosyl transferase family 2
MAASAPIVVFAYRRPDHLRRTLRSLMDCDGFEGSPVIVYCDGPRNAEERRSTEATREVAREMLGSRAEYHFSDANLGLSRSVIHGVTEVTRRFGRSIVIEDDLQLAPDFLGYMNAALDRYADDPAVFQISGYMFDVPEFADRRDALFLPLTVSWGWATWQRAWNAFDPDASGWEGLRSDRDLRRRFNLAGAYDYATMLESQMAGRSDSWAVRWYWTVFRAGGLVLFPPLSLVGNIGMDGSGTHGRGRLTRFGSEQRGPTPTGPVELPGHALMNARDFASVRAAIWRQNGGWLGQARMRLRRLLKPSSRRSGTGR